jgi:hypothetical protein
MEEEARRTFQVIVLSGDDLQARDLSSFYDRIVVLDVPYLTRVSRSELEEDAAKGSLFVAFDGESAIGLVRVRQIPLSRNSVQLSTFYIIDDVPEDRKAEVAKALLGHAVAHGAKQILFETTSTHLASIIGSNEYQVVLDLLRNAGFVLDTSFYNIKYWPQLAVTNLKMILKGVKHYGGNYQSLDNEYMLFVRHIDP